MATTSNGNFPTTAGIFLGVGLGGFFDGIVLHQVLQWHHMLSSAGYSSNNLRDLEVNIMWDGFFHVATYLFVCIGLAMLCWAVRHHRVKWATRELVGTLLIGFGLFNVIEGIVDHHILKIHHVNESVSPEYWIYWDIGFLAWGAAMLIGGWLLMRAKRWHSQGFHLYRT